MSDVTQPAREIAERFRWFASEYLELRRTKGNLWDHLTLTDRLADLIKNAFGKRLLPKAIQSLGDSLDGIGWLSIRLIGYQSFVDVTESHDDLPEGFGRILELRPGWMGEIWPQYFPSLTYLPRKPDEPYGEMIVNVKKQHYFIYVGAFAKLCELLADEIEREMAADNQADEDGVIDPVARKMIWGDDQFDDIPARGIKVLSLLLDAYRDGNRVVTLDEIVSLGVSVDSGMAGQVFKYKGKKHKVTQIIDDLGGGRYRLKPPRKNP